MVKVALLLGDQTNGFLGIKEVTGLSSPSSSRGHLLVVSVYERLGLGAGQEALSSDKTALGCASHQVGDFNDFNEPRLML